MNKLINLKLIKNNKYYMIIVIIDLIIIIGRLKSWIIRRIKVIVIKILRLKYI